MMTLRRNRYRIVVFISLLLFLFSGQAGANGFLWCLSDDGHSELKHAHDTCCNVTQDGCAPCSEQDSPSLAVEGDACSPCRDIAVSCETAFNLNRDKNTPADNAVPPASGLICATFGFSHPPNYPLSFHLPPPRVNQTLLMHRTVVLLN